MAETVNAAQAAKVIMDLRAAGASTSIIASVFGISARTVQRWLAEAGYGRASDADRRALIGHVHERHHAGLSIRQIVADLETSGQRRSVGWVSGALRDWTCPGCSQATPVATEQRRGGGPHG